MPEYLYRCPNNHWLSHFCRVANHTPVVSCECGMMAKQVITAPMMVKVAQDVCYDSPITGEPITSWDRRKEDLKRHDCVPYDPEMKTDQERRLKAKDEALDQSIGETVEKAIEQMPTWKRAKLHSELVDQGVTAEVVRQT